MNDFNNTINLILDNIILFKKKISNLKDQAKCYDKMAENCRKEIEKYEEMIKESEVAIDALKNRKQEEVLENVATI